MEDVSDNLERAIGFAARLRSLGIRARAVGAAQHRFSDPIRTDRRMHLGAAHLTFAPYRGISRSLGSPIYHADWRDGSGRRDAVHGSNDGLGSSQRLANLCRDVGHLSVRRVSMAR